MSSECRVQFLYSIALLYILNMNQVFTVTYKHLTITRGCVTVFRDSRQWASSEPSWQCSWPSQRCQSGMQRGGLRHRNWPWLQRPGAGRGGGVWVGPGAGVTEPLAAVTEKQGVMVGIHYRFVLLLFCLNVHVYFNLGLLSLVNRSEKN